MLPILIAARAYGARTDLGAGDAMLALGSGWVGAIETFAIVVAPNELRWCLPGLLVGLLAGAISAARIRVRRCWCERAARVEIEGIRLRRPSSATVLELRHIDRSRPTSFAVVERLVVDRTTYRSGVGGERIATVRVPRALRDALPATLTP